MANLWVDGFEGYAEFETGQGYMLEGGGPHASATAGRGGGAAIVGAAARLQLGPLEVPAGRTLITGAAKQNGETIGFLNSGFSSLLFVDTDALGRIVIQTYHDTVRATIDPPMRLLNAWRYYEHKVKVIDPTHISYELRIDEITVVPMTTYAMSSISDTTIEVINFDSGRVGDDWYVNDDTGSAPDNDYWGDTRMIPLFPVSDVSVQWTPSSGVTNFDKVDEPQTNDDTDYVQTGTVGFQDLYEYTNTGLPGGTTIRTVAVMTSARRLADSGPRQLKAVLKSGATSVQGPLHQLSDSYYMVQFRNPTDPNTGVAWTPAGVDALQAGQILIA